MTTTAQGAPPAGAPAPTASPAPPAQGDARLDRIEQTQREQGAVLHRLEAFITGAGGAAQGQHAAGAGAQPQAGDIAAQVRQEIQDADQRRKAEESEAAWKAGVTEAVEKLKAERSPREPETGWRARAQRFIVGKDPA